MLKSERENRGLVEDDESDSDPGHWRSLTRNRTFQNVNLGFGARGVCVCNELGQFTMLHGGTVY